MTRALVKSGGENSLAGGDLRQMRLLLRLAASMIDGFRRNARGREKRGGRKPPPRLLKNQPHAQRAKAGAAIIFRNHHRGEASSAIFFHRFPSKASPSPASPKSAQMRDRHMVLEKLRRRFPQQPMLLAQ